MASIEMRLAIKKPLNEEGLDPLTGCGVAAMLELRGTSGCDFTTSVITDAILNGSVHYPADDFAPRAG